MSNKRAIFNKYVRMYGVGGLDKDVPVLFNITGKYRDEFHARPMRDLCAMTAAFVIISYFVSFAAAIVAACLFPTMNWFSPSFDNEFEDIGQYKVGVAIPTREEEARRGSRNFEETGDKQKLLNKLDDTDMVYNEHAIIVQSVGSSSARCIFGYELAPMAEFGMGVDAHTDDQIRTFLKAHAGALSYDGILVIMNSAGYGIKEDAGIVYSDNKMEYDTIMRNIVPRMVGGAGCNTNAMGFILRVVILHRQLDLNYVLAIVPRGDKTMPQGGSHITDMRIEVSGELTTKFELVEETITETTITDADGNTHGSMRVFG